MIFIRVLRRIAPDPAVTAQISMRAWHRQVGGGETTLQICYLRSSVSGYCMYGTAERLTVT
jgi:hypothetical protein